jgi:prepilin-type N-terminal cleavage/methylation domain-containing protein
MRARTTTAARSGFTLVELVVAVSLTAMLALLAHRILTIVLDGRRSLLSQRGITEREATGQRWLASAFLSLEVGQPDDLPFEGGRDAVAFSGWLMSANGWMEREHIKLSVNSGTLVLATASGRRIELADSVQSLSVDYLLTPGADTKWAAEWISPTTAPVAIRLRVLRTPETASRVDTTLVLIKARG